MSQNSDPIIEVIQVETRTQFGFPLADQMLGRKDEDIRVRILEEVLPDNCSGLDRLTEAYLIGKNVPLQRVLRDPTNDVELMRIQLNR